MSIPAVKIYLSEVEKIKHFGGTSKETSIRTAFQKLLNEYARQKDLILVAEIAYRTDSGKTVYPDGTLKDILRQDWGYWESKDEHDDLDTEIEKKFAKSYPKVNIIFEDSQTAVLIQNGQETARVQMKNAEALDRLLNAFISFERPEVSNFRKAIENFKEDVPTITESLRNFIIEQNETNPAFIDARDNFLELCRKSINPAITEEDAREMLIQHILTADIFNRIFDEPYFHQENNIARELETVLETFFTGSKRKNALSSIQHYFETINATAAGIADHHEKQKFLKVVYETFYKSYNPKAADRLGVVYTPSEIVKFMIESTDYLLYKHFGRFLEDKGVEILDPATGTGTFICDIIDHIQDKDKLRYKYENEIHANEVAILPYYIANLNIEFTYKQKMGGYKEFENLCFVDTLDNMGFDYKGQQTNIFGFSLENIERIKRQNDRKISVIIGNPPYNANQMNENDNNKNRPYPVIDKRIKDTYIAQSTAQKTKLYDMYSRFYRWAMDRLGDEGIIAFITNRSFINSRTFDGFRKIAASEFDHIYIIDLGGDVRANPKLSGPKHNVFAIQTGVAIMFLVKTKENMIKIDDDEEFIYLKKKLKLENVVSEPVVEYGGEQYITPKGCMIHYLRRPEMETAREKLEFLSMNSLEYLLKSRTIKRITPDKNNNWVSLTENDWEELIPLANKETKLAKEKSGENAVFKLFSLGVSTNRDDWVFDFSKSNLTQKIKFFISFYNSLLKNDDSTWITEIKWSEHLKGVFKSGIKLKFDENLVREFVYRPYTKVYFYSEKNLSDRLTLNHYEFLGKHLNCLNNTISFSGIASNKDFQVLCTDKLSGLDMLEKTNIFPLYFYDKSGNRHDNITDWGLSKFREQYEERGTRDKEQGSGNREKENQVQKNFKNKNVEVPNGKSGGEIVPRPESLEGSHESCNDGLPDNGGISEGGNLRSDIAVAKSGGIDSIEYSGGTSEERHKGIHTFPHDSKGIDSGSGNTNIDSGESGLHSIANEHGSIETNTENGEHVGSIDKSSEQESHLTGSHVNSILDPHIPIPTPRSITKEDIFHYVYGVLHNPEYRKKYELNLKREFPRVPFYDDFWKWAGWGAELMELHINYETVEPYPLNEITADDKLNPKAKLKADKDAGTITLDENTSLTGIPAAAWTYKLGNRSALDWILDQYKEKKPKDPTIAEKFNTYRFADYKAQVIDLIKRVTTVSVRTMEIIAEMEKA